MKKLVYLIALLCLICKVYGQDIIISFQPKVSGTPIDSVRAINLRTNQTVKLSGSESLVLVKTPTGINPLQNNLEKGTIYPNPTDGDATFTFSIDKSQQVELRLYNSSGQILTQNRQFLTQGSHSFEVKFPVACLYFLSIIKSEGPTSFKAVYTGRKIQNSSISYIGSEDLNLQKPSTTQLKSALTDKTLAYSDGDFIQYTVISGQNTTIVTDIPIASKAIDVEFVPCIDKDNKSYKVVKIGNQWWMAENLAYLPAVSPPTVGSNTEPIYYIYDYNGTDVAAAKASANYSTYGVLYNWPAAKAACPSGWHLPSDAEWKQLEMALGMTEAEADGTSWRGTDQGKQMKATSGWYNNRNGTNTSGFTALPGGGRLYYGAFGFVGVFGSWCSSTEYSSGAWGREMGYNFGDVSRGSHDKGDGSSVRCVRDSELPPASDFTISTTKPTVSQAIQFTDRSANTPTSWLWDFGDGTSSTEQNPSKIFTTASTYTISLKVTNSYGDNTKTMSIVVSSSGGNNETGSFTDPRDGKNYKIVKIGDQWWMAENLAYFPAVSIPSQSSSSPYYYVYDYNGTDVNEAKATASYSTYGVLYNWEAALVACPPGWHLPSDAEWKQMEMALGMTQTQADGVESRGTDQGTQMKSTSGWSGNSGTNTSGFTALPSGRLNVKGKKFETIGDLGIWWSSTVDARNMVWSRILSNGEGSVIRYPQEKNAAYSVRCVKNSETASSKEVPVAVFTASATSINVGQSLQFTDKSANMPTSWLWDFGDASSSTEQNPFKTYSTAGTFTVSLVATNSYGTSTKSMNIFVSDKTVIGQPGTLDYAGKTYKTITIDGKEWMAENLAYLPAVSPPTFGSTNSPYYYVYDYAGTNVDEAKTTANYSKYGVLYNWTAAKAACPPGWHLPSDAEWKQLEMALGMTTAQADAENWRGTDQGIQMKATKGWNNTGSGTNTSGFSALPSGVYNGILKNFSGIDNFGLWWSSTESNSNNSWGRFISDIWSNVCRIQSARSEGFSVRCVKDYDAPVTDFTASATSIPKGRTIQFTDKSTNSPTSWSWDFGDGTTSNEQNPSKTYSTIGTFSVTLVATNLFGNNSKTLTNYITITETTNTFTDQRDGKSYKTVQIGNQIWMSENLAYLPSVSPPSDSSSSAPYYYVYGYSGTDVAAAKATTNYSRYGVLYNWEAAKAACPPGWHLPSETEWKQLVMTLGMTQVEADQIGVYCGTDQGSQMKDISGWYRNNGTNSSGFAALPSGYYSNDMTFQGIELIDNWWSSTESSTDNALYLGVHYENQYVYKDYGAKLLGFSVRCIKD